MRGRAFKSENPSAGRRLFFVRIGGRLLLRLTVLRRGGLWFRHPLLFSNLVKPGLCPFVPTADERYIFRQQSKTGQTKDPSLKYRNQPADDADNQQDNTRCDSTDFEDDGLHIDHGVRIGIRESIVSVCTLKSKPCLYSELRTARLVI